MLTDNQLLGRLSTLCRAGRRLDVGVVLLLIEVEDRQLELKAAYPSLYDFCRHELGMSDGTTHRRVEAVRLVRKIPALAELLREGKVTLSALARLRNHIDETNYEALVARVAGKSRKQIDLVIAELAPKPDVPALMRRLPTRAPEPALPLESPGAAPTVVDASPVEMPAAEPAPPARPTPEAKRARLDPLSPERWKLQLTASRELHDKLERLQTLMRHKNPSGDLAVIVEAAVDELLARLEKKRGAEHDSDAAGPGTAKARPIQYGAVSAATRRAVFKRDGHQCTFEDTTGRRCGAKELLEVDHIHPRAMGGSGELENLRLRCRSHNRLAAEEHFGREYIALRRAEGGSADDAPTNENGTMTENVMVPFEERESSRAITSS